MRRRLSTLWTLDWTDEICCSFIISRSPRGRLTEIRGNSRFCFGIEGTSVGKMYQRQSIVNRRKIPPSKKNDENIDREYDVQMCYLRKRQENFKDIEQLVRTTVSPTRDEVLDSQQKWKGIMDLQLRQKEEQHEIQSETDYKLHCFNEYVQRCMGPHSKEEEEAREQARRDYLRVLMEENMKIAAEKIEWKKLQKQKDIALENYRLTTPSTWNRRHYV